MTKLTVRIAKLNVNQDVDTTAFPDNVQAHVLAYGWTQILNDTISQYKGDDIKTNAKTRQEAVDAIKERLDDFAKGVTGRTRTSDPVTSEMRIIATAHARDKLRTDGVKSDAKDYSDKLMALRDAILANKDNEAVIRKAAEAIVTQKSAIAIKF